MMNLSHRVLAGIVTGVLLGSLLTGSAFKAITALATATPELPAVDLSSPDFTEVASACDNAMPACVDKNAQLRANDEGSTPRQFTAKSEKSTAKRDDVVLVTYEAGDSGDSGIVAVSLAAGDGAPGSGWTRGSDYSSYHGAGSNSIVAGSANGTRQLVSIFNTPGIFNPAGSAPLGIPASIVPAGTAPGKSPVTPAVVSASTPNAIPPNQTTPRLHDRAEREHKRKPRPLIPTLLPDFVPHFARIPPPDIQTASGTTAVEMISTAPTAETFSTTVILDTPMAAVALFAALNDLMPTGAGLATSIQAGTTPGLDPLAIPAPASIILLGLGLAALGWSRGRRAL